MVVPQNPVGLVPEGARHSIGEAMVAAEGLGGANGDALAQAAREAFSSAHGTVLLTSASLIAVLAVAVLIALRNYREPWGRMARSHG
ncbi:hypothetical protein N8D56_03835 [Devosia sp. A8/3-2]|nr:hypothetical protein N8D56_03835 [Devosia sp. A8/3-2]